nr:nuclear transport factor 2 family protein [Micromonospora globispora]
MACRPVRPRRDLQDPAARATQSRPGRDPGVFADLQTSLPRVIHYLMNDTVTVHGDTARGEFKGIAAIWAGTRRHLAFGVYTGDFVRLDGRWHFQNWQFDLASPPPGSTEQ